CAARSRRASSLPFIMTVAATLLSGPLDGGGVHAGTGAPAGPRAARRALGEQYDASGRLIFSGRAGRVAYDDGAAPAPREPGLAASTQGTAAAVDESMTSLPFSALGPGAPGLQREWYRAFYGVGIGATGLVAAD